MITCFMALRFDDTLKSIFLFVAIFLFSMADAQNLKPGFDKSELIDMLKLSARFGDTPYFKDISVPATYRFVYRSPVIGLENCWDLWIKNTNIAIINIRGSTGSSVSWLANLYAAMVPARGELRLSENDSFHYELASNPRAAVHVGWLVAMAFLSKDILPKIDSCYKHGIKDILITGHSQGGAIAYLLTAWLYNLQKQDRIPPDIRFKTYCTAGPKPGNLYFAYDYEAMTQDGWAYNVVNAADWVPEIPFSIQTIDDVNTTNPFSNAKAMIRKEPFPKNWVLKYAYNRLSKPAIKARNNYLKYLGKFTAKSVKKHITGYRPSAYYNSNHYVRTGNIIVLPADDDYYKRYPDNREQVFIHHFHQPYIYLIEKLNVQAR